MLPSHWPIRVIHVWHGEGVSNIEIPTMLKQSPWNKIDVLTVRNAVTCRESKL